MADAPSPLTTEAEAREPEAQFSEHSDTHDITLPILDISEAQFSALLGLDLKDRFRLVERIIQGEGHDLSEVPEAWAQDPLQTWCWLVLTVNEIPFSDTDPRPLVHYGIDLGFADRAVSRLVWILA